MNVTSPWSDLIRTRPPEVMPTSLMSSACIVTVLTVAHDVNPILPYLDLVVYLARGQVLAGPPADVIRTETLTRLYGAPIEVIRTRDGRLLVVGQQEAVSYHGGHHSR